MPCVKLTRVDGTVASVIDRTSFAVRLADGTALTARTSRRVLLLQKRYAVGDEVQIGMLTHGRSDGLILTGGVRKARPARHLA
jgi:translation initiation factor IF-1